MRRRTRTPRRARPPSPVRLRSADAKGHAFAAPTGKGANRPSHRGRAASVRDPPAAYRRGSTRATNPVSARSTQPRPPRSPCSRSAGRSLRLADECTASDPKRGRHRHRAESRAHRREPAVGAQVLAVLSHRVPRPSQRVTRTGTTPTARHVQRKRPAAMLAALVAASFKDSVPRAGPLNE